MYWVYTKYLVMATAFMGVLIHTAGLVLGKDYLIEHIYTPTFDIIFAIPITLGTIGLVINIRKTKTIAVPLKIIYYLATVIFAVSIPIHLSTYITHSTDYIRFFPPLYSIVEIPLFLVIFFGFNKIK